GELTRLAPGADPGERAAWAAQVQAALGGVEGDLVRRLVELVQGIGRGRRSPSAASFGLLAAYERLGRLGRPLNAVAAVAPVTDPPPGPPGPLAGQPVAIKDIIAVAGLPTRCGSPARDPPPARRDATLVGRLRAAGAEVLAATQCLEYAAGFAHPEVGDTRNPRDPSRTSGGSSGGSAAVVAAGVCDLAIGTDTGGSIRIPAAYCGVVGLKPSYGLIPVDGIFPLSPSCDHAGTLTATVAGAAALAGVLAGPGHPPGPPDGPGPGPGPGPGRAAGSATFTIGLLTRQLDDASVTPEVRDALLSALDQLAAAGWEIRELTAPWLDELPAWEDILAVIVAREASQVHRDRDQSRYAEGTRALLSFGAGIGDEEYERALRQSDELTAAIESSLDGVAALAGPTVGYTAPEEDPPFGADADHGEGRFTGPYNLSGHPAISLPVPTAGLPAGLQLAGRRGGDRALLQVAAAAERLLAGRDPDDRQREN
ncbi:MAG: aspartyl-tRNA(Asn)/glutamyl-tRNA(Gln) amidotransferase subunit, partial [Streptosporangiaceae bacterium]|nr:aspartyl-tRNA(Asn)/glutamyl-tRNA(Gln) amidotransferase subunit [Streptosporangiaceae bacterium]